MDKSDIGVILYSKKTFIINIKFYNHNYSNFLLFLVECCICKCILRCWSYLALQYLVNLFCQIIEVILPRLEFLRPLLCPMSTRMTGLLQKGQIFFLLCTVKCRVYLSPNNRAGVLITVNYYPGQYE